MFSLIAASSVGAATAGGNATSPDIDTTGATLLVAITARAASAGTLSDSKGNSWTSLTNRNQANASQVQIHCVANPTSVGSGHTATYAAGGPTFAASIAFFAFSGALLVSPFDVEDGNTSGTGTTLLAGNTGVTPSEDNELVITGVACRTTLGGPSINGGFGIEEAVAFASGVHLSLHVAVLIQTTAAPANPTWSGLDSGAKASAIACFKAAPAGASGQPATKRGGGVAHMGTQKLRGGLRGGVWGRTQDGVIVPRRFAA